MLLLLYASRVHLTMSTDGKETASLYQGGSAFSRTPDPIGQDGTPSWGSWASKGQGGGLSSGSQSQSHTPATAMVVWMRTGVLKVSVQKNHLEIQL